VSITGREGLFLRFMENENLAEDVSISEIKLGVGATKMSSNAVKVLVVVSQFPATGGSRIDKFVKP